MLWISYRRFDYRCTEHFRYTVLRFISRTQQCWISYRECLHIDISNSFDISSFRYIYYGAPISVAYRKFGLSMFRTSELSFRYTDLDIYRAPISVEYRIENVQHIDTSNCFVGCNFLSPFPTSGHICMVLDLYHLQLIMPGGRRTICMIYRSTCFLGCICTVNTQILHNLEQRQLRS